MSPTPGIVAICLALVCGSLALPVEEGIVLRRDDSSSHSSGLSPSVWIPILVVGLLLAAVGALTWSRKGPSIPLRSMLSNFGSSAALASGAGLPGVTNGTQTRELTAEQLAGGSVAEPANNTSNGAGQNRSQRRARRTRRTPSQISTTSLPAYMKEPGDQELVIFRGADELEDGQPIQATVIMPAVDEDDADGSIDNSHSTTFVNMRNSDERDSSQQHLMSRNADRSQRSFDTGESTPDSRSLLQREPMSDASPDPRGEAPPYFEVLASETSIISPTSSPEAQRDANRRSTDASRSPVNTTQQDSTASRRRSGIRNLFNAFSPSARPPVPPVPPSPARTHARVDSGPSVISLNSDGSHDAYSPAPRRTHRPSNSGGGSGSLFRAISRQRSTNTLNSAHANLTSPSTISLHSISSPLTHTLTKSEITYPRAGPTAEQIKLISSRESFARFGMPYGADAIAYAASASRQELNPPPDFEDEPRSSGSGASASPPLVRHSPQSSLSAGDVPRVVSNREAGEHADSVDGLGSVAQGSSPDVAASPEVTSSQPAANPTLGNAVAEAVVSGSSNGSLSAPGDDLSRQPVPQTSASTSPHAPSAGPSSTAISPSPEPSRPPLSSAKAVPPTSFRQPAPSERSVSRASSITSFATAAETVTGSDSSPSEPSTPRLGMQHLHDATDATVTPMTLAAA